ncbi:uncharacterized protein LOC144825051 [Lissotriton helveticus]
MGRGGPRGNPGASERCRADAGDGCGKRRQDRTGLTLQLSADYIAHNTLRVEFWTLATSEHQEGETSFPSIGNPKQDLLKDLHPDSLGIDTFIWILAWKIDLKIVTSLGWMFSFGF